MTYPAGPLPNAGAFQNFSAQVVPSRSIAIAASTAYDFTDPATGIQPCITEFYAVGSGNFIAQLAGDAAGTFRTYAVTAGTIVRGVFSQVSASSTAAGFGRQ